MKTTPLGLIAARKAARRGYTTYGLAGTTQLLAAKREGWIKRTRKRDAEGSTKYEITPEGIASARRSRGDRELRVRRGRGAVLCLIV